MAMEDLRHAKNLRSLKHRTREQGKTFSIVGVIAAGSTIQRITIEEWRIIHEVEAHSRMIASRNYRAETVAVIKRHGNAPNRSLRVGNSGLPVLGHVDAHLVSESGQGSWQSPHYIGQASGLREGNAFRSGKSNLHGSGSFNSVLQARRTL
jgi:hypothetical protein